MGMAANPLTWQELDAFCRRSRIDLTAWEADLIFRLDDVVLGVFAKSRPASNPKTVEPAQIPVDNVGGLKGLFRGLAVRKAAAKGGTT